MTVRSNLMLLLCVSFYSPSKVGKPHTTPSNAKNLMVKSLLRQKNTTQIKIRSRQTVTAIGGQNSIGLKCHTVTNRPFFELDKQSVLNGSQCLSGILSQGRSVTVVNCYSE